MYGYGARFYDPSLGRFFTQDRFAEKYIDFSPYQYAANNPIFYLDADGNIIVIGNNTSKTLTNLAQIAATSKGRERIDRLIISKSTYKTNSIFWSNEARYDGRDFRGPNTISFPGSVWKPRYEGGVASSMFAMGHEMNHAYDHDRGLNRFDEKARDFSAVTFTNYLRAVYGKKSMRRSYDKRGLTFSKNPDHYNSNNERITDFTQTDDIQYGGNTVLGFSFNKSEGGEESSTSYIISMATENGQYMYRIFNNKEDYNSALGRIRKLKEQEDEDDQK